MNEIKSRDEFLKMFEETTKLQEKIVKEEKENLANGYCVKCDEHRWHNCVFCGRGKRISGCLIQCRIRQNVRYIVGMIGLLFKLKHPNSPWIKLRG